MIFDKEIKLNKILSLITFLHSLILAKICENICPQINPEGPLLNTPIIT